ncbi:MAG: hypothetical protein ACE5HX_17360, partial [bacterium]
KQAFWVGILNKGMIGLGILIAFLLVRTLLKTTSSVLQIPVSKVAPVLENNRPYRLRATEEEEISEDIYIRKLSPEARAKLKAKDKMTSDVVNYSKKNPEDAARLIRSWLTGVN